MRAFLHKITKRKKITKTYLIVFLLCFIAFDFSRNNIFFCFIFFSIEFSVRTLLFYLRFIWCESLRSNNHKWKYKKNACGKVKIVFYSRSCSNSNITAKSKNLIISTLRLNASQETTTIIPSETSTTFQQREDKWKRFPLNLVRRSIMNLNENINTVSLFYQLSNQRIYTNISHRIYCNFRNENFLNGNCRKNMIEMRIVEIKKFTLLLKIYNFFNEIFLSLKLCEKHF